MVVGFIATYGYAISHSVSIATYGYAISHSVSITTNVVTLNTVDSEVYSIQH